MGRTRNPEVTLLRPRHRGPAAGFTLIEMLVVVLIIGILMTMVVGTFQYMVQKARKANVESFIAVLDHGCMNYRTEFRAFPPAAPFQGSKNLHYYLGRPLMRIVQHGTDGIMEKMPALVSFTKDRLDPKARSTEPDPPAFVVDIWQRPIEFASPGKANKKGVDIWSPGKNGQDDKVAAGGETDDICNWVKEY